MEVRTERVSRSFGSVEALRDVSLVIPRSRKVALIGPNGSGKSTLTRIIMGMLTYDGNVWIDGQSPMGNRVELARRLAYVPQSPPQLSASVSDIVRAVASLRRRSESDVVASAARIELDVRAIADRPLRSLSSGMKQKLLIALALAAQPDMYILDEPTASLDPQARSQFYEYFHETARSATVLLCSHRFEEIAHLVDHVILLEGGQVRFDGPLGAFLRERAQAIVEVTVAGEEEISWLADAGFVRSSHSSWVRTTTAVEKLTVAREVLQRLDGRLANVNIRDMEVTTMLSPEPRP